MKRLLLFVYLLWVGLNIVKAQPPKFNIKNKSDKKLGYYFLAANNVKKEAHETTYQLILDESGEVAYYNKLTGRYDFKLQSNGLISYFNNSQFYLMDSTFKIIDSVSCTNGLKTDSHEFLILPNGHFLLIGLEMVKMDLSQKKIFNQKSNAGSSSANVEFGVIQELDKQKKVVFEWHSKNYFTIEDVDPFYLNDTLYVGLNHMNSIDVDAEGNFIISNKFLNEITFISRREGLIKARIGGKKNQFNFINDSIPFLGQHDARIHKNNILTLFDNGHSDSIRSHPTRCIAYQLDFKKRTANRIWNYQPTPTIYSERAGSCQLLKDGSKLINYGQTKNSNILLQLINKNNSIDFQLSFQDTLVSYRSFYYEKLPWKLERPITRKISIEGKEYLEIIGDYKNIIWLNGETSKMVEYHPNLTYQVFVSNKGNGFIGSMVLKPKNH